MLEADFSEKEIWDAVKECEGNKALGPNGFNLACYQRCWTVMKDEVVQVMKEFHLNEKLAKGVNSSFISLIPKDCSIGLTNFRPISLVSSVYKILAKVDQEDCANEVVDGWKKTKRRGIILKLDFEKAYDSVNWGFQYSMMSNFGFGDKWVEWIKTCISLAIIFVLVNGSPTSEFSSHKGLRQGDLLSPFLFNLVEEGLNILMERAKEVGLIKGAAIGHRELKLSHIQFADDTIIFCEANWEEIIAVKRILRCANPRNRRTWQPVVDKFKKKLALWKRKCLSFVGRLTLIKSVLSGLPVYFLSIFKMLVGIAKQYGLEDKALWKQVVCSKYGEIGGRWSPLIVESGGVSILWKDILSLASIDKDGSLFDFYQRKDRGDDWNFMFRRQLFAWEGEELYNLNVYLQLAPSLRNRAKDYCTWLANPSGVFYVASLWTWMDSTLYLIVDATASVVIIGAVCCCLVMVVELCCSELFFGFKIIYQVMLSSPTSDGVLAKDWALVPT
ncbi:uncharacterized protein LOC114313761 [Camellia sinensis]|uniref:uncharacterized protein LOC114313761 n=1 Tax=Camellia sinensis TaxID=4442 RepID=UPI0010365B78|nr:uncharacterized protein LOC114313761 [Camellia sinensis]